MMQKRRLNSLKFLALGGAVLSWQPVAQASWLDSDFYCRVYGCVVVHDGFTFDVYDNYIFATGGTIPVGGRMIPWTGNPFQGAGAVRAEASAGKASRLRAPGRGMCRGYQ